MGVVAFSIITAIGVIPAGLTTMRQAMDNTVESQIIQRMSAEVSLTPYTQLAANFANRTFYYDDEGTYLTNSPATRPKIARYSATASLATPKFPGSASVTATGFTNSMWTVRIQMTTAAANAATNFYSIQAPNTGN